MLFRSPRCYFRCMAGARHEHAPNFSCPDELDLIEDFTFKINKFQQS